MPHSKNSHTSFSSDPHESFDRGMRSTASPAVSRQGTVDYMMNSSLGSCQGYDYEAIMIQEALATTTQPRNEQHANSNQIIKFEIAVSLILILFTLLIGVAPEPDRVDTSTDIHHASEPERKFP